MVSAAGRRLRRILRALALSAVASAALPQGNLVQNPGGEAGPGQTSTGNPDAVKFIPAGWEWSISPLLR